MVCDRHLINCGKSRFWSQMMVQAWVLELPGYMTLGKLPSSSELLFSIHKRG